jgi:hypothetical protein
MNIFERLLFLSAGGMLVTPEALTDFLGLAVLGLALFIQYRKKPVSAAIG